jgi:hypothetical protein
MRGDILEIEYIKKSSLKSMVNKITALFSKKSDIVDNCVSSDVNRPLSANQGKQLQKQITDINNSISVATLEEVKAYLEDTEGV